MRKVTERIIELGDKKQTVTSDDLPYIIADILRQDVQETRVHILNYNLSLGQGLHPVATLKIRINDADYEETASGDGQYDAFMKALRKIYKGQLGRDFPMLTNYSVTIPPGGRTDAFVQTFISWEYRGQSFKPADWMQTRRRPRSRRPSRCSIRSKTCSSAMARW